MARLLVLYNQPADPAAFDRYYAETHIPLANKIPGLRSFVVSSGSVGLIAGGSPAHLIAELDFEGQAAAADVANFADGGVTILAFDTKNV